MDKTPDYESGGRRFESCWVRQFLRAGRFVACLTCGRAEGGMCSGTGSPPNMELFLTKWGKVSTEAMSSDAIVTTLRLPRLTERHVLLFRQGSGTFAG